MNQTVPGEAPTSNHPDPAVPVAIIGIAGLFPQARDVHELWTRILQNVDCLEDVPPSHWRDQDYFDPDPQAPDKTYSRRGGFLPAIDFDPVAFGLPPFSLQSIDSSQLLSLAVAKAALEDAGYGPGRDVSHERTSVVLGVAGTTMKLLNPLRARLEYPLWERVLRHSGFGEDEIRRIVETLKQAYVPWDEDTFPGFLANVVSGRIANRLDLGGMSCAVDAACASSLCAVSVAMSQLAFGLCDLAISGGVDTDNSITAYLSFSKTQALSRSGNIRPFDEAADGTLISEGIGMLVLKRLTDAIRDGDRIYAVLRGIGSASDGRSKSIYAPRASGQVRALAEAYRIANVPPASVSLVEAHATGTKVGDDVEVEALCQVFGDGGGRRKIALGSIKSQIGHTKAAAGAASLIKVALALYRKVLPATHGIEHLQPRLREPDCPFFVPPEATPWFRLPTDGPRRAGVSAFGFGGTNFHAVLEEAPGQARVEVSVPVFGGPQEILLAAASPQALKEHCEEQIEAFREGAERAWWRLRRTPVVQPAPGAPRLGFIAQGPEEAVAILREASALLAERPGEEAWSLPAGAWYRREAMAGGLVALFPGQGSQYPAMGRQLALCHPEYREALERLDERLVQAGRAPVSGAVFRQAGTAGGAEEAGDLDQTLYAQAGIGAFSMAVFQILRRAGLQPDFAAGHSFGELTALWAAGALSDGSFLDLVAARGVALSPEPGRDSGAMLAVRTEAGSVHRYLEGLEDVHIANFNSDSQVVLGGSVPAIDRVERHLRVRGTGLQVARLAVAAAFHTPCVHYARAPWRQAVHDTDFSTPRFPVCSNVSGRSYPADPGAVRETLLDQPFQPVRFRDCIESLYTAGGRIFLDIGPRSVLTGLVRQILGSRPHVSIAVNPARSGDSEAQLLQAAMQLRVAGTGMGSIAPRPVLQGSPPDPSPATFRINGAHNVFPERHRAFEQSLEALTALSPRVPDCEPATSVRQVLEHHHEIQQAALEAHRQYLEIQAEQSRLLADVVRELSASASANGDGHRSALLETALKGLSEHQAHLLRVHEQHLREQTQAAESLIGILSQAPRRSQEIPEVLPPAPPPAAKVAPGDAASPAAASPADPSPVNTGDGIVRRALDVVSRKTGYPADLINLEMDLESDLGIDSIKRVEILAALQDEVPGLAAAIGDPADLLPERSLGGILERLRNGSAPRASTAEPIPPPPARGSELAPRVLSIVSAKTGYPADLIDLDADLEADLGVDSIKRVEILAALRDELSEMPEAGEVSSALGRGGLESLRTVRGIVEALRTHGAASTPPPATLAAVLRTVPAARPVGFSLPPNHVALVAGASQPLLDTVLQRLGERGIRTVEIRLPPMAAEEGGDAALESAVQRVREQYGPIGLCLFLHPHSAPLEEETQADWRTGAAPLRSLLMLARQVGPDLTAAAPAGHTAFLAACRLDGQLGLGGERPFDPLAGGMFGLIKSLRHEWPGVHVRGIDLGPQEDPELDAQRLVEELFDASGDPVEVAYGPQGRVTCEFAPAPAPPDSSPGTMGPESVFLVTGGAGGITAPCILAAARRFQGRFILLGRTPFDENGEPSWARGCEDPMELRRRIADRNRPAGRQPSPRDIEREYRALLKNREIRATLDGLAAAGASARYLAADVGDAAAVRAAVHSILAEHGRITGIIHAAGVLRDRRLTEKTADDFDAVFRPKVLGLFHLLDHVESSALRHLILFSSTAAAFGNAGQTDYAMANEVLNKTAHEMRRRHPHCRVVALNWGPWNGGMVTEDLSRRFAARGVRLLSVDAGVRVFLEELTRPPDGPSQVVVGDPLRDGPAEPRTWFLERRLDPSMVPSVRDHVIDGRPVLPVAWALAWIAEAAESLYPGYRFDSVEELRVLHGIVFENEDPRTYRLALTAAFSDIRSNARPALTAELYGPERGRGPGPRLHYSGKVHLLPVSSPRERPRVPWRMDGDAEKGIPAELLEQYRSGPIRYGPSFHGVRRILQLQASRVVTECVLPPLFPRDAGAPEAGPLHPYGYDLATHGILIWLRHFHGTACMPAVTGRYNDYHPIPVGSPFYVTLDVHGLAGSAVSFDFAAHDEQGSVYAQGERLEMIVLAPASRLLQDTGVA